MYMTKDNSQWFPWTTDAVALIDRLTHHAEIVSVEGESYRKREAEQAQERGRSRSQSGDHAAGLGDVGPELRGFT